jgi:S-adenosylmethionine:tRNA-ribosyltransferase-isomerase (queuine synthetase)
MLTSTECCAIMETMCITNKSALLLAKLRSIKSRNVPSIHNNRYSELWIAETERYYVNHRMFWSYIDWICSNDAIVFHRNKSIIQKFSILHSKNQRLVCIQELNANDIDDWWWLLCRRIIMRKTIEYNQIRPSLIILRWYKKMKSQKIYNMCNTIFMSDISIIIIKYL